MHVLNRTLAILMWAGVVATAQPHHDPRYLVGGDTPVINPAFASGVHRIDAGGSGPPTWSTLLAPGSYSRFTMDADNRQIVLGVEANPNAIGITSGLYRFDPSSNAVLTIVTYPMVPSVYHSFGHVTIDHNGDYIYTVGRHKPFAYDTFLMKVDRSGAGVTTLLAGPSLTALQGPVFSSRLIRDIDSGRVLLCVTESALQAPTTVNSPILAVDTDSGAVSTWAVTTGYAQWKGDFSMPQNHRTGWIDAAYNAQVYRQSPGNGGRSLVTLLPNPHLINGAGAYDLQTAPNPRLVYCRQFPSASGPQTYVSTIDPSNWAVTSTGAATPRIVAFGFDFYRGRHTQSIRTSPRRWTIRLSAPRFAGYGYVVAAGLSGVRPGIALADGSRINLVPDALTALTLGNGIPTIWTPGPGVLNAAGVAHAGLDLSSIGTLGIPLWIAWAVLDPASPTGFAYLPDTWVMRV